MVQIPRRSQTAWCEEETVPQLQFDNLTNVIRNELILNDDVIKIFTISANI